MAGLVFYWSQAAFLALVAALVFRPAAGDTLSPLRRRAFALVLGAALASLALLAGTMAALPDDASLPLPPPSFHARSVLLAVVAGAMFAWFVDAALSPRASADGRGLRRALGALLALAGLMPAVVLVGPWRAKAAAGAGFGADEGRAPPLAVSPALDAVVRRAGTTSCGASRSTGRQETGGATYAHLACAPGPDLHLARQWVITTELRAERARRLYLVKVCALEDGHDLAPWCRYTVEDTPPGAAAIDLLPRTTGTRVDASEPLEARYDPEREWRILETPQAAVDPYQRTLVDARWATLGIARAPAPAANSWHRLRFPPAPWALLLGVWALAAGLALRAHRAAGRRLADLASARQGELRDGLLHVAGEAAPRQLVAPPQHAVHGAGGPVVWNARIAAAVGEPSAELVGYRRTALAHAADLTAGELACHRARAGAARHRAFALFAALIGGSALPVLVATAGHLTDGAAAVQFQPRDIKRFGDATAVCPRGERLVDGSLAVSPPDASLTPPPPSYCLDTAQVDVASYRECVESGACHAPSPTSGAGCAGSRGGAGRDEPMNGVTRDEAKQFCDHEGRHLATTLESPDSISAPPWICDGKRCPKEVHADEIACDAEDDACGMGLIADTRGAAEDKGFRCVSEPLVMVLHGWR